MLPEFRLNDDAALIGIPVASVWSHLAFARDRKLKFPLVADFDPRGPWPGVMACIAGTTAFASALFVLDGAGIIRWRYVSPIVNPGADGILTARSPHPQEATN